ncbi:polyprenyl synthetase family protein [Undibacterium oligocarboniphilum]|uniref:Polyprenyl synthetase family protein n=1 Tax=Undibacterium oligocarboniphilum TaxID=666702 RepID=A0A850QPE5_9BURK|nr:farnesyl diphosphate synthase [Undibacterium oligocarboniphilum]MBC3870609.1 polyprenyl synthetase family protein [Undibacterium oligocarboniphilum]NVO78590.1 polyprenyl synthetase family protein [Undibacterium oligocarboniphilum]
MSDAFRNWMEQTQKRCETDLSEFIPAPSTVPAHLHDAMRYAALDGGKRIRPLLVFAAGRLFQAPEDLLRRAAAATEMIHAYSLVHDDMPCMDDDALRRGKPTVHVKYDEATALLVGDALQAQAFLVLSEGDGDPAAKLAMVRVLAHAAGSVGMCGGQAIDLASVGLALTREQLEQMHRLKTGALLRASVLLGAMSGKLLSAEETAALDTYAAAIGLAFQVVDDVLDATADSATLGKTAGKDAADNKPTYVSLLGLEASRQLAIQLSQKAHEALQLFGTNAQFLHDLADLIVQRQA